MKKKRYSATYKDKTYYVSALCEEEVWHAVLQKNGIEVTSKNAYDLATSEKMDIYPV